MIKRISFPMIVAASIAILSPIVPAHAGQEGRDLAQFQREPAAGAAEIRRTAPLRLDSVTSIVDARAEGLNLTLPAAIRATADGGGCRTDDRP